MQKLRDSPRSNASPPPTATPWPECLRGSRVAATDRLADPTDLAYSEDHLTDPDVLAAAIDDLLTRKPHLASRRVIGDVGQGAGSTDSGLDLAGMLRRNAS